MRRANPDPAMPTKPSNPCRHPRCASVAVAGRAWCAAHQPLARVAAQAADVDRGSAAARGYGHKWRVQSLAFRGRHPVCGGYLVRGKAWTPELGKTYALVREVYAENRKPVEFLGSVDRMHYCALRKQGAGSVYELNRVECRAPAVLVDHIEPHRGNQGLFWSESNWQSLCKECHDTKTAKHDGGFRGARAAGKKPVATLDFTFQGGVA
jgi:5-methylcytosine-specific restriction enzyme A